MKKPWRIFTKWVELLDSTLVCKMGSEIPAFSGCGINLAHGRSSGITLLLCLPSQPGQGQGSLEPPVVGQVVKLDLSPEKLDDMPLCHPLPDIGWGSDSWLTSSGIQPLRQGQASQAGLGWVACRVAGLPGTCVHQQGRNGRSGGAMAPAQLPSPLCEQAHLSCSCVPIQSGLGPAQQLPAPPASPSPPCLMLPVSSAPSAWFSKIAQ